jgi:hypothetical protein
MLQSMPQTAEHAPIPAAPSFAGMLAAMAAPAPERTPVWNDDALADDVATLSYERALRAHARYKYALAADSPGRSLPRSANPEPIQDLEPIRELWADDFPIEPMETAPPSQHSGVDSQPKTAFVPTSVLERDLKCASITIRLSKAENAQLRQRAAEAGLTISDYLRSCTFEAESLRAMVKDTMAQLRASQSAPPGLNANAALNANAGPDANIAAPNPARRSLFRARRSPVGVRRSWFGWLRRLLPSWQPRQHAARA